VANELATPAVYDADGFEDGGGGERSALNLDAALNDLEADTALCEAIGSGIIDNFIANKRHEAEKFTASGGKVDSDELSQFELDMYLPYH